MPYRFVDLRLEEEDWHIVYNAIWQGDLIGEYQCHYCDGVEDVHPILVEVVDIRKLGKFTETGREIVVAASLDNSLRERLVEYLQELLFHGRDVCADCLINLHLLEEDKALEPYSHSDY